MRSCPGAGPHRIATLPQCSKHMVLDRVFLTAQRWEAHQFLREGYLLSKALLDRGEDALWRKSESRSMAALLVKSKVSLLVYGDAAPDQTSKIAFQRVPKVKEF